MIRSQYLSSHGINISPGSFVVFNLFFFVISGLLSLFILPTWKEIKENAHRLRLFQELKRRKKHIKRLEAKREANKHHITETTIQRVGMVHHANYSIQAIRKKYHESVSIFIGTNLAHRTDRTSPDCFLQVIPDLNIDDDSFHFLNGKN